MRLTDSLSAGIAVTAPFGNSNEYDTNWYGRYLGTKTAAVSADINPAIAWQLGGASPLLGMVNGAASSKAQLPATTGLSVTSEVTPDLTLSAEAQFSQWSVFKTLTIESQNPPFPNVEGYRDSWMVAVGGVYRLDE